MMSLVAPAALVFLSLTATAQAELNLSAEAKEVIQLYRQLHEFKDNERFHEVGFGVCCEFNAWLQKVDDLTQRTGITVIREVGILPAELRMLGMDYLDNKGRPSAATRTWERAIRVEFRK